MKINKMGRGSKRILTLAISALILLAQPVATLARGSSAPDDFIPQVSGAETAELQTSMVHKISSVNETGEASVLSVKGGTTAYDISDKNEMAAASGISAAGGTDTADLSAIDAPRTAGGVYTWDSIWFGKYWQEDTNGDGHCFDKKERDGGQGYSHCGILWRDHGIQYYGKR